MCVQAMPVEGNALIGWGKVGNARGQSRYAEKNGMVEVHTRLPLHPPRRRPPMLASIGESQRKISSKIPITKSASLNVNLKTALFTLQHLTVCLTRVIAGARAGLCRLWSKELQVMSPEF